MLSIKLSKPKNIIKDPYILDFLGLDEINQGDNKTIAILLCSEKNDKVVKYTLPEDNEHIFASKYKLYPPSLKELKNELESSNENTI